MKKLTALVMKEDADALVRTLMWLKCVEVIRLPAEEGKELSSSYDGECTETSIVVKKLEKTIKTLTPYAPDEIRKQDGLFARRPVSPRVAFDASSGAFIEQYSDMERVEELGYRTAELENTLLANRAAAETLEPWKNCAIPLDDTRTKETRLMFGTLPAALTDADTSEKLGDMICAVDEVSADSQNRYVTAIFHNSDENEAYSSLSALGFIRVDLREYAGTAAANLARLKKERESIEDEFSAIKAELTQIAVRLPKLKLTYDYTATRYAQMLAKQKMFETGRTVMLTGWIPVKAEKDVTAALGQLNACYEFTEPEQDETVPVLLRNPAPCDSFEGVVSMYSMPKYGTFDPTVIMSFFYFVIFGFMLADVAYGLLITVLCTLLYKKANLGDGTKNLVRMFAVCGISCIIAGVLFGSYFGDFPAVFAEKMLGVDLPSLALWFDPVSNPIMFLVLSLVIGAVHLVTGICIKFGVLWKQGKRVEAIFDQGSWVVLFAGVAVAILVGTIPGVIVAGAGALMLVFSQGRAQRNPIMKLIKGVGSLYGIMNYVSDLLSYSRIMALGLSSAVVASVMNLLATLLGPSVVGYIAMVIIFIIGHALNIAINMLGSFVHTSRLQYIEFFGKFFEDGGKPFNPVVPSLKYNAVSADDK